MNKKSPGLARWKRLLSIKTFPFWKTPYVPNLVKGAMIVNENTYHKFLVISTLE